MSNTNDLISRGDAIDAVYERIKQIGFEENADVLSIRQAVREVPAAQPEPKGKWIRIKASCYQCNLCGVVVTSGFSNFCHRCGADMRQGDTE